MTPNLLVLGGTTEATALARCLATAGVNAMVSLAGRVNRPVWQPLPQRVGGFGGVAGLAQFLRNNAITHVVDATHPFAAEMSRNAVAACAQTGLPLVALSRPVWVPLKGDAWHRVQDIAGAVRFLDGAAKNVMLAVGRMHVSDFACNPHHFFLLRFVDPPREDVPLPRHHVVVSRGPFHEADDRALMLEHSIDVVVSKNSGGSGAYAKIAAARSLGLPVIMIDRPPVPERQEVATPDEVLEWLNHAGTDLGV